MNFRLREMKEKDLSWVLKCRNHPDVLNQAETPIKISKDVHKLWFLDDKTGLKFVFEVDLFNTGVIILNSENYWGFYIDPKLSLKRRGLGLAMLSMALVELKLRGLTHVKARVKVNNEASNELHKKLGFNLVGFTREVNEYAKALN